MRFSATDEYDTFKLSPWNPITGCTPISTGCDHCCARLALGNLSPKTWRKYQKGFTPTVHWRLLLNSKEFFGRRTLHHEHLHPWIQPVVTMGDLYHPAIPDRAIDEVMGVVAHADAVAFWNLTKYIERAQQYWADRQPPYNWWQGVSVETPAYLPRIHFLQQPGFTIRIVAFEPLLAHFSDEDLDKYLHLVDWVLIGSEYRFTRYSGEEIRPAPVEWIEDLIRAAKCFRLPVMITQMAGKAKEKYKPLLWGDQRGWPHVRGKDAVVLGRTWRELPDFEFRPYETEHYD